VTCAHEGETATFEVARGDLHRTVAAQATLPGRPSARVPTPDRPLVITLAEDPLATSLSEALTHLEPDPVWERALSAATGLSP
jgi:hypothetical protein